MSSDDDDWVGTPPEGRISRDRANPGYWNQAWLPKTIVFGVLGILVVVVILLALL
ncbi:MAG: hypothetical protein HZB46_08735 [Solirubrobacterales bacterium]|nr:hypothetical protein [Solirubrobacterales bacterium]